MYCKISDRGDRFGISISNSGCSSNGYYEIEMGPGDDTLIVKEFNGFYILEINASNNQGWSWLEIGFIIVSIKGTIW